MTVPLVHVPNWLGDSIMARPFLASLLHALGSDTAMVVAHPRVAPLWRAWPGLSVLETRPGPWLWDVWSTARKLRTLGHYDCGYLLSASFRSAALFAVAGVTERIGFAVGGRSWLLTVPVPRLPAGRMHYGREFFNLLAARSAGVPVPRLVWTEASRARALGLLQSQGLGGVTFAAVAVGAAGKVKRYPLALWHQVIQQVSLQLPVVLVGTASEATLAEEVRLGHEHSVHNLCGATDLAELAIVLESAAGFAGVDSGAAHLAATVGCPTLALFGPGDPVETAPVGEKVCILRDGLWCSPCRSRECLRPLSPSECMDRISPGLVASTLLAMLRSHPG